jgi:ribosomal protein S18 acetylase RimI-like enzyme
MSGRADIVILDVEDAETLERLPMCADPRFDHRSCDYWEDAVRGSKAKRPEWWRRDAAPISQTRRDNVPFDPFSPMPGTADNPFAPTRGPATDNPFAPPARTSPANPFAAPDGDALASPEVNPFAPPTAATHARDSDEPRKMRLLARGRGIFGSYAKALLLSGEPAVYAQFGPLSAYPRAQRIRELYPSLPQSPLPAVITCIATTGEARGQGHARHLVEAVCGDLAERGFSAVEAYPDLTLPLDEASAALPVFWRRCGFQVAADDARYPVMRRELG